MIKRAVIDSGFSMLIASSVRSVFCCKPKYVSSSRPSSHECGILLAT